MRTVTARQNEDGGRPMQQVAGASPARVVRASRPFAAALPARVVRASRPFAAALPARVVRASRPFATALPARVVRTSRPFAAALPARVVRASRPFATALPARVVRASRPFARIGHPAPSRSRLGWATARSAFTLTELLVSIGILMGMMAMMAMVFTTATRASGQAQVSTALYRQLRQVAASIEDELAAMEPGDSILAVAGVDQLAYRTPDDLATGRSIPDPANPLSDYYRADMLMLVVPNRAFEPYVYQPAAGDVFDTRRVVVFGHANIGMLDPDTGAWLNVLNVETDSGPSPIPASQWHLARRVIGFPVTSFAAPLPENTAGWPLTSEQWTGKVPTIEGAGSFADVYEESYSGMIGSMPLLRGFFRYSTAGVVPQIDHYDMPHTLLIPTTPLEPCAFDRDAGYYFLLHTDDFWYRQAFSVTPTQTWERIQEGIDPNPPATSTGTPVPPRMLETLMGPNFRHWVWPDWFRNVADAGRGRSWLDPSPPAGLAQRMAPYFLPGCMDFKVELTWDDPREIAVDPDTQQPILFEWTEDPANDPQTPVPQPIEWVTVPDGEIWVWSQIGIRTSNYDRENGDLRDMTSPSTQRWPRAIRITLRAVDSAGRLPEPVTWTITHAWD